MVCLWINQLPQILTVRFCYGRLCPQEPHYLRFSKEAREEWPRGLKGRRNEEVGGGARGPPRVPLSHIRLRKKMSSVKLREWSVPQSPAGSTEGAFVHHHLAPITARQNCFSAVGRRVNGPRVGCEERPCPHTPTRGQGLIESLWCGGWDFCNH